MRLKSYILFSKFPIFIRMWYSDGGLLTAHQVVRILSENACRPSFSLSVMQKVGKMPSNSNWSINTRISEKNPVVECSLRAWIAWIEAFPSHSIDGIQAIEIISSPLEFLTTCETVDGEITVLARATLEIILHRE